MALRRWKPYLGAFTIIDAAIEGADSDGPLSRDEFRTARARIVELLCDADDGEKAEKLCTLLDEAMAESLATLRAVPAEEIARRVLASGDLVGAVGALMRDHASERVRQLAGDIVRGWRAGARAEFARAKATMDVLDGLSSTPSPPPQHEHDTAPPADTDSKLKKEAMKKKIPEEMFRPREATVISSRPVNASTSNAKKIPSTAAIVSTSNAKKPSPNMEARQSQPKKTPHAIVSVTQEEKKMESTKRKLHERYQEAEDAKRRRTIQVIKPSRRPPPGTTGQRQHQAVRARGSASCAAERVFKKSCSLRLRV